MNAALVTGSSGAIGTAMVQEFARAGYQVVGIDARPPGAPLAGFVDADLELLVREPRYLAQTIERVRGKLLGASVQVIVNNAAVQRLGAFQTLELQAWQATINVNLLAPVLLVRAFYRDLVATHGSVVNVASIHAEQTKPQFTAYATSKAALVGLTRALAVECGAQFRVNAIAPAAVETPMLHEGFAGDPGGFQQLKSFHPTKSIGSPEQIAALALAMCSPQFHFLNGSIVSVDGGISARLHDPA